MRKLLAVLSLAVVLAAGAQLAAAQSSSVHFTAAGDYRMSPETVSVLEGIGSAGQDFHVALGDLSYGRSGEEQRFCDFVRGIVDSVTPFELISGNHESDGTNGNIDNFAQCLPNDLEGATGTYGRQWYVDVPAVNPVMRIVLASPGLRTPDGVKRTYAAGTPEYEWLAGSIDDAHAAGIPWVVAAMHYPCFSIGVYGCVMGRDTMDLLVQKHVDLVLMGHEHNYSRTFQLGYGPGCEDRGVLKPGVTDPACIRDEGPQMVKGAGTVFAIVGTGGTTLRDLDATDPEYPYFAAASGLNANPAWGYLDVSATADRLDAGFVPTTGTFTDAFSIVDPAPPADAQAEPDDPSADGADPPAPVPAPSEPQVAPPDAAEAGAPATDVAIGDAVSPVPPTENPPVPTDVPDPFGFNLS